MTLPRGIGPRPVQASGPAGPPGVLGPTGATGPTGSAGPTGTSIPVEVGFHIDSVTPVTWASMPAAVTNLGGNTNQITKRDLTNVTQARLVTNVGAVAGFAGSLVKLVYSTSLTFTAGSFSDIAASPVSCSLSGNNTVVDSGWFNVVSPAKADVYLNVVGSGGNGTISPTIGNVIAHLR